MQSKTGAAHNRPGGDTGWRYGSKSPTESILCSIGIHLRNPCGAYRPIATAAYNPKAQFQTTNTRKRRLTTD